MTSKTPATANSPVDPDPQVGAAATPIVRFENVSKSYDGKTLAVDDLNLVVERGEFLTLLGPSGSGKTTSLMMLAGFEVPTSGNILMDGTMINRLPPYKREIGVVFQNYALFPHMTVADNIAFPLSIRKRARAEIEASVGRILEIVKLTGLEGRRPRQLSGGQQQRVALARALVFEPQLVLLDEPLGALDKQLREQLQYELKAIHRELGVTMIYVTHDQTEALSMSDRIVVFKDGVVQQVASPEGLYEEPNSDFVAQFVGESNRLTGTLRSRCGRLCEIELKDGQRLVARLAGDAPAGSQIAVAVRPETIRVGAERELENAFDAVVQDLTYLGDHIRIRLSGCGRDDLIAKGSKQPGAPVRAPGERVRITWAGADCFAFPV